MITKVLTFACSDIPCMFSCAVPYNSDAACSRELYNNTMQQCKKKMPQTQHPPTIVVTNQSLKIAKVHFQFNGWLLLLHTASSPRRCLAPPPCLARSSLASPHSILQLLFQGWGALHHTAKCCGVFGSDLCDLLEGVVVNLPLLLGNSAATRRGGGVNEEGDVEREKKTHHLCLWDEEKKRLKI